jgi:hypothetical protein
MRYTVYRISVCSRTKIRMISSLRNFSVRILHADRFTIVVFQILDIKSNYLPGIVQSTLRSEAPHALKSTCLFKLKRMPDGTPSKFKARLCVRGDLQKEGVEFFETYATVWQWSTVRMILTMVLQN